ncbi:hypothetical protein BFJ63_vAg1803 [Fusarium oxysporum f. sp. narcissi]|uniref:Uncharacterized protein n=2 Tax=Fusarium oxysporum TaxID=5507 RepID=A0A4Q2W6Q4_FUSOX|nr:hypothetical protein BFJ65_g4658 [Fusarium oxysporum f. sp. cepae]RKK51140.1 hypothetical protein BFJ67_g6153 [Fusarium oxysporum f. sp. cepae]RKK53879.1 hypothetical protein BFJ66_g4898 [Fusarium oxysporum f. sp. cepae]RKK91678.1 hypothetical protein BFJ71_g10715 [Fusarium oxysporum]RYC95522.1 hypothetical protein BFJ63_vAg1803 [Fusarium oxysporum f. sp. narcissi]
MPSYSVLFSPTPIASRLNFILLPKFLKQVIRRGTPKSEVGPSSLSTPTW